MSEHEALKQQAESKVAACMAALRGLAQNAGWDEVQNPYYDVHTFLEFRSRKDGPTVRLRFDILKNRDFVRSRPTGHISVTVGVNHIGGSVTFRESKLGDINVDRVFARIVKRFSMLEELRTADDIDREKRESIAKELALLGKLIPPGLPARVLSSEQDWSIEIRHLSKHDVREVFRLLAAFRRES